MEESDGRPAADADSTGADAGLGGADSEQPACTSDRDCRDLGQLCDRPRGVCVECLQDADCAASHECAGRRCIPYTPCDNSLDCSETQVCNPDIGRCVECVADADCEPEEQCAVNRCRPLCESDRACTSLGLLCDTVSGHCVECRDHGECASTSHCVLGDCRPDVCSPGEAHCDGNDRILCDDIGSGFLPAEPCPARHTCADATGSAVCEPWVCTAGARECGLTEAIECAEDGLSVVRRTDCSEAGKTCVHGECSTLLCPPGELYCDPEEDVRRCSDDGLDEGTLENSCGPDAYCDASGATPQCRPRVCEPGAPVCNATCNARGSGYVGGEQPCPAGLHCSQGSCGEIAVDAWDGVREGDVALCSEDEDCSDLCGARSARCFRGAVCLCEVTPGVRACHPLEPWRTDAEFLACPFGHTCTEQHDQPAESAAACWPARRRNGDDGLPKGERCTTNAGLRSAACELGLWCHVPDPADDPIFGSNNYLVCGDPCDEDVDENAWVGGETQRNAVCGGA